MEEIIKMITDNGIGMEPTDALLAFQRHATSKIYDDDDLFNIHSLGFRGEALPSISAVSEVELTTCHKDQEVGTYIHIKGGKLLEEKSMAAIREYMSDKTIRSSIYTFKKKEQPKDEKQKKTLRIEDSDELEKQIMTLVLSDEYQIVNDGWASVYITDSREMLLHARPAIFITDGNDGGMAMALGASEVIERPVVAGLLRKRLVRVLSDERRQGI